MSRPRRAGDLIDLCGESEAASGKHGRGAERCSEHMDSYTLWQWLMRGLGDLERALSVCAILYSNCTLQRCNGDVLRWVLLYTC